MDRYMKLTKLIKNINHSTIERISEVSTFKTYLAFREEFMYERGVKTGAATLVGVYIKSV